MIQLSYAGDLDPLTRIFRPGGEEITGRLFASVVAGFPSPADDHHEEEIDIGRHLVRNPSTTFFVRVEGDSMTGESIHPDDILVVDRSLRPATGNIVVAALNDSFTVKRLRTQGQRVFLEAANPRYRTIEISEGDRFSLWGVVTFVLRQTR